MWFQLDVDSPHMLRTPMSQKRQRRAMTCIHDDGILQRARGPNSMRPWNQPSALPPARSLAARSIAWSPSSRAKQALAKLMTKKYVLGFEGRIANIGSN